MGPGAEAAVVRYLQTGAHFAAYRGFSHCRFGCLDDNGCAELWDGKFLWPEGLAHYVAAHSVGLPENFITHMDANGFVVPSVGDRQ